MTRAWSSRHRRKSTDGKYWTSTKRDDLRVGRREVFQRYLTVYSNVNKECYMGFSPDPHEKKSGSGASITYSSIAERHPNVYSMSTRRLVRIHVQQSSVRETGGTVDNESSATIGIWHVKIDRRPREARASSVSGSAGCNAKKASRAQGKPSRLPRGQLYGTVPIASLRHNGEDR